MGLEQFEIEGRLGKGAFASVYKVKRKSDGTVYAMKKVGISKMSKKEVLPVEVTVRLTPSWTLCALIVVWICGSWIITNMPSAVVRMPRQWPM